MTVPSASIVLATTRASIVNSDPGVTEQPARGATDALVSRSHLADRLDDPVDRSVGTAPSNRLGDHHCGDP